MNVLAKIKCILCFSVFVKDVQNLSPATDFYKKFALDCAAEQVAVDLFLLSGQYADIASLSKFYEERKMTFEKSGVIKIASLNIFSQGRREISLFLLFFAIFFFRFLPKFVFRS